MFVFHISISSGGYLMSDHSSVIFSSALACVCTSVRNSIRHNIKLANAWCSLGRVFCRWCSSASSITCWLISTASGFFNATRSEVKKTQNILLVKTPATTKRILRFSQNCQNCKYGHCYCQYWELKIFEARSYH